MSTDLYVFDLVLHIHPWRVEPTVRGLSLRPGDWKHDRQRREEGKLGILLSRQKEKARKSEEALQTGLVCVHLKQWRPQENDEVSVEEGKDSDR